MQADDPAAPPAAAPAAESPTLAAPSGDAGLTASNDDPGGLAGIIAARTRKAEALRQQGVDPFPARVERTHSAAAAVAAFEALEAAGGRDGTGESPLPTALQVPLTGSAAAPEAAGAADGPTEGPHDIVLAGRLVGALRHMGGSSFVHLMDASGQVQLHLRRNRLGDDAFAMFKDYVDSGDFVQARGSMFRTKMGEVSLAVDSLRLVAKSLLPLPEKWHGLTDVETRFRQRYLDLVSSGEVRQRFLDRTRIITAMRRFLDERGFIEVETPVLQPIYGGGAAKPFTTHYNALDQPMFLRIADELYLKRLLVGGFERVYEIAKDFRNEGIDRTHLPEFTQMECYWAYADYEDVMTLVEDMVSAIALELRGTLSVTLDGRRIDLAPPWRRLKVRDAIVDAIGIDIDQHADLAGLTAAVAATGHTLAPQPTWAKAVDEILSTYVEHALWQPTFLVDYPIALSPLAKSRTDDPRYVERFEPFIGGFEIGNAFTELNDPLEQERRFEAMGRQRAAGDEEAAPMDTDFVEALMHGMPPTGGLGIGVDRLVMVLTGQDNIREVVLFPQLRHRAT